MPPQATTVGTDVGFRYTPSVYLQRTRLENRPWTEDDEDDVTQQAARYDSQRKETTISQQFVNRVQKRKELYKAVLNGTQETVEQRRAAVNNTTSTASASAKASSSWKEEDEETVSSAAARQARAKRLAQGQENYYSKPTIQNTEQDTARRLRAQRLRTSLKATEDEKESQEQLQTKRAQQKAEETLLEKQREEMERSRIQQEQQRLQQERLQEQHRLEAQQRMQRRQQEEAKVRQEEARIHQELLLWQEEEELSRQEEEERSRAALALEQQQQAQESTAKPRRRRLRHSDSALDPDDLEWPWIEEFQQMLRDSGVLKNCVSSCFGQGDDQEFSQHPVSASSRRRKTRRS
jgi:hypothetical protein